MRAWAIDDRLSGDAVVVVVDLVLLADQGSVEKNERLARSAVEDAARARLKRRSGAPGRR